MSSDNEIEKAIDSVAILLDKMSWRYDHNRKVYLFVGEDRLGGDTLFDTLMSIASIVRWARSADIDLQLMGSMLSDVDKASFHQAKNSYWKKDSPE